MQSKCENGKTVNMGADVSPPPGFKLLHSINGHGAEITQIAWSPDGRMLASSSKDGTIGLWDIGSGKMLHMLEGHSEGVLSIAWSRGGSTLASASKDKTVKLWNVEKGELRRTLEGHTDSVYNVAWLQDGWTLASASDGTVIFWNAETGKLLRTLSGGAMFNFDVVSPDGRMLASAYGETIQLRDSETRQLTRILEGHISPVTSISFSSDGRILASKSNDRVHFWRCDIWEIVAVLNGELDLGWFSSIAFHPHMIPILATLSKKNMIIHIWKLDFDVILDAPPASSVHYTNAKVVMVGDTGVGKSGLGLVLTGKHFTPTESTHGRRVWKFDVSEVDLGGGRTETRETFLWDMAGQPGYRLIHQLHLNEVAVGVVVFDSRSETDPFAGVQYWDRALRHAQRIQGKSSPNMKKFLVAARTDRGGISVSRTRMESLIREFGFDNYFETSAKEGLNITGLAEAIRNGIDWASLPKVSSTKLFQRIKTFLIEEKEAGRLLSTTNDLYTTFLKSKNATATTEELYAQFETCIKLVESRDLIKRLSFGNLVLLQPELLDAYVSAIINEAKNEPDGMGCIAEENVREGRFRMPQDERIKDKEQEKLLLIAAIEDMLRYEIALRESTDEGVHLVFPSQFTREWPEAKNPKGKAVIFNFEGPVLTVYATLAVRLSHSGLFTKKGMWKNTVIYTAGVGGMYGLSLQEIEEGQGELTLFFDSAASEETRFQFEEYVQMHLQRRALPNSIHRRRVFVCPECNVTITDQQVLLRRQRGYNKIKCNVCETEISLLDREERLSTVTVSVVPQIDRLADAKRESETATFILQGKIETNDFDVFLCHNTEDKPLVKEIGNQLREQGILPWLDEWELRPGRPWQQELEKQIGQIKSAAVFVGKNGIGPWQREELNAFLREFVRRGCPVIPVLLPDAKKSLKLPIFLKGLTWVDFRKNEPDPMKQLIWGITGRKSLK